MADLLRHTVATLAYRGGKALRDAPAEFADYEPMPGGRTPIGILAHIGDLLDWALLLADGKHVWRGAPPMLWDQEVARFFRCLEAFDQRLSNGVPVSSPEKLFQGPIADALTHVGQLAMLRRMAGCKMRGENYFKAAITAGCVGADQPPAVVEFE